MSFMPCCRAGPQRTRIIFYTRAGNMNTSAHVILLISSDRHKLEQKQRPHYTQYFRSEELARILFYFILLLTPSG